MRRLLSAPLTYLFLGEALVLVALGIAGWQLLARARMPPASLQIAQPAPPEQQAPDPEAAATPDALPSIPVSRARPSPSATARAGAQPAQASFTDPAYWTDRLGHLNSDQAELQQMQWNVIQAVKSAAERYLREVVLTAVERAQRSHPIPAPSPRPPPPDA